MQQLLRWTKLTPFVGGCLHQEHSLQCCVITCTTCTAPLTSLSKSDGVWLYTRESGLQGECRHFVAREEGRSEGGGESCSGGCSHGGAGPPVPPPLFSFSSSPPLRAATCSLLPHKPRVPGCGLRGWLQGPWLAARQRDECRRGAGAPSAAQEAGGLGAPASSEGGSGVSGLGNET